MMAKGDKICLAAPVLASIYSGLNSISESHSPGQIGDPFPIHYVYSWLATYYQTHFKTPSFTLANPKMVTNSGEGGARYYTEMDARKKIFKGDVSWLCNSRKDNRDFIFYDNRRGSREDFEYFICLRPSFLVLRRGSQCKAEPYMPHRFSRQFGFYQAYAPGLLAKDVRYASLTEGFRLHRQYDNINSQSRATFPMSPAAPKKHFSNEYKAWLIDVSANLLENHFTDIAVNGNPNVPVGEEGTQEQRDQLTTSRNKKTPAQEDMSSRDRASGHAVRRSREEKARQRSSDEDAGSDDDQDRCWKRPRGRPLNQDPAEPHVSNDVQSSNHPVFNGTKWRKL
ncbi:PREDICTED: uncharacterized protein LOC109157656 [Ipomoea nil]|uniref:uncharacterized protein LOC109157656 n=1 Tax=Ipomoea nil TaxID=35883 RepID=UPI000900B0F6|nr:PREDICTED: uncharacterized protein LOC109157656 [Ipomoea nil]